MDRYALREVLEPMVKEIKERLDIQNIELRRIGNALVSLVTIGVCKNYDAPNTLPLNNREIIVDVIDLMGQSAGVHDDTP